MDARERDHQQLVRARAAGEAVAEAALEQRLGPRPPGALHRKGPCVLCQADVEFWSLKPEAPGTVYYCGAKRCPKAPAR